MKNIIITLTAVIIMNGCSTSKEWTLSTGQHPQHIETQLVKTVAYDLLVYTPKALQDEKKLWPLIIFLHGSGERGNDPNRLKVHSLPKIIDKDEEFPFIVVSPQCPDGPAVERRNRSTRCSTTCIARTAGGHERASI
jgi:predicted peptidase